MSNRSFLEDDFDLEEYKQERAGVKVDKLTAKNKKVINILTIGIVIIALVILIFLYAIGKYLQEMSNVRTVSEKTRVITAQIHAATPKPTVQPTATPIPTAKPMNREILKLREEFNNDDIVAYIKVENTTIDYPVVQYADNDFYLNRDLNKEESIAGSIFMDFRNDATQLDSNTVIYGHNMRVQSMFHDLRYYIDNSYYKNHKIILLKMPHEETLWEIFSFYKTDISFNYIQTHFQSEEDFFEFAQEVKERTIHETEIELAKHDKILTLSTCTNEEEDTRYVVHAKLLGKIMPEDNVN